MIRFAPLLLLSGCAILPDAARIEAVHDSHLLQHLGAHHTDYGRNTLEGGLVWRRKGLSVTVEEGYAFHGLDGCENCPRELFEARVGYEIPLR